MSEHSDKLLRAVIDHAVDGLIVCSAAGAIRAFNPACERFFGYAAEEVLGRDLASLMPEPHRSAHAGYLFRYVGDGKPRIIGQIGREMTAQRKNGELFPIDISVSDFRTEEGQFFCAVIRDVTARRQADQKVALLASLVESSDDAIISKTLDGTITTWNVGAERLFGYSAAEAVGQNISIIIPDDRRQEELDILTRIQRDHAIDHLDTVRRRADGSEVDVSVTVSPIHDQQGRLLGASKIARDISHKRRVEEALVAHTQALERSNSDLDDFAYIASHDLKEPLRGIHNHARFLLEDNEGKLDAESARRLHRLVYLSRRMEQLVSDLLYFSRIGRQQLAIQPTNIGAVVEDVAGTLEHMLSEAGVRLMVPQPLPTVACDRVRITEVFRNLVTNAVKYNDSVDKTIEIGFLGDCAGPSGAPTRNAFYVKDNGYGIAPEFHQDIFRIFRRLHAHRSEQDGTGVGLTFVKKIIERHGGDIWLDSAPGQGTTFFFTMEASHGPERARDAA